jgi:hypothetical protein
LSEVLSGALEEGKSVEEETPAPPDGLPDEELLAKNELSTPHRRIKPNPLLLLRPLKEIHSSIRSEEKEGPLFFHCLRSK